MKTTRTILFGSLTLVGLQFGLGGCVTDGTVAVGVQSGVYYGYHRDPWFRDDRWVDGRRWRGDDRYRRGDGTVDIYISPPRIPLPPPPPRIRLP